jgi:hypothetical protein
MTATVLDHSGHHTHLHAWADDASAVDPGFALRAVADLVPARRGAVRIVGSLVLMGSGLAGIAGAFMPWTVTTSNVHVSGLGLLATVPQPRAQVAIALGSLLVLSGAWALAARRLAGGVWFMALALGIMTAVVGLNEITAIQRGNAALGGAIGQQGLMSLIKVNMKAGIGVHLQVWAGVGAAVGALLCAVRPRLAEDELPPPEDFGPDLVWPEVEYLPVAA